MSPRAPVFEMCPLVLVTEQSFEVEEDAPVFVSAEQQIVDDIEDGVEDISLLLECSADAEWYWPIYSWSVLAVQKRNLGALRCLVRCMDFSSVYYLIQFCLEKHPDVAPVVVRAILIETDFVKIVAHSISQRNAELYMFMLKYVPNELVWNSIAQMPLPQ